MKTTFLSSLALVLLVGCAATTPVNIEEATEVPIERKLAYQTELKSPSGALVISRDDGFLGSGCYYAMYINGVMAARFDTGEKAKFFVPAGEVLLRMARDPLGKGLCSAGQDQWTQRESYLKDRETKHFRMTIDMNGRVDVQRSE